MSYIPQNTSEMIAFSLRMFKYDVLSRALINDYIKI